MRQSVGGIPKLLSPPSPLSPKGQFTRRRKEDDELCPMQSCVSRNAKRAALRLANATTSVKKKPIKAIPDIDMERSKDNYHLVNPPRYTYKKEINRMVAEAGCRTRKDSVMMVETLITASPEFMNQPAAQRTESVFYDGSGFHFRACRGEKYPLRSRPHGRENARICTSVLCRLHQTISCLPKQF